MFFPYCPFIFVCRRLYDFEKLVIEVMDTVSNDVKLLRVGGLQLFLLCFLLLLSDLDCLVGLVVKASALRAEGPGFESRLRRDFFGVESYQ